MNAIGDAFWSSENNKGVYWHWRILQWATASRVRLDFKFGTLRELQADLGQPTGESRLARIVVKGSRDSVNSIH